MTRQLLLCVILLGGCGKPADVVVVGNVFGMSALDDVQKIAIDRKMYMMLQMSGAVNGLCAIDLREETATKVMFHAYGKTCEEAAKLVLERIGKP